MSNVPMTRPQEALAILETDYYHSSSFVQLADGRILQVVLGGGFVISEDGGLTWSKLKAADHSDAFGNEHKFSCLDTDGQPVYGNECALVKLSGKNSIGLSARRVEAPSGVTYGTDARIRYFVFWRSDDGGKTWSPPVRMSPPGLNTAGYQDSLLRTSSGRIIRPVFAALGQTSGPDDRQEPMSGRLYNNQFISTAGHFFDPSFTAVYFLYSDDEGWTWKKNADGELMIMQDWNAVYSCCNESSVTEVAPGRLLVFMRNGLGRIFQAWSSDNGETWTRPQPTSLASSTCPAQIRTLPNGHLLCVWNQESEEEIRKGLNRTRVSAAISRNGGSVWEFFQNVASIHETTRVEPGQLKPVRPEEIYFAPGQPAPERRGCHIQTTSHNWKGCYPSVLVMKDRVLVTHTHVTFDEHPTEGMLVKSRKSGGHNQKLKVLPLSWFYGGREPADNPFLAKAYEPAKP